MTISLSKWDKRFVELAEKVASWSKDPERQVGCVLVQPGYHQFAMGYNGFPHKITDKPERLTNTSVKNSMTVHAELNAILNRRGDVTDWLAYVTAPPCVDCCKALIQAGIAIVVCPNLDKNSRWHASQQFGLNLLIESGLQIVHYDVLTKPGYDKQGLNSDAVTDQVEKVLINQDVTDKNHPSLACGCPKCTSAQ